MMSHRMPTSPRRTRVNAEQVDRYNRQEGGRRPFHSVIFFFCSIMKKWSDRQEEENARRVQLSQPGSRYHYPHRSPLFFPIGLCLSLFFFFYYKSSLSPFGQFSWFAFVVDFGLLYNDNVQKTTPQKNKFHGAFAMLGIGLIAFPDPIEPPFFFFFITEAHVTQNHSVQCLGPVCMSSTSRHS